ncbi:uncharacterized protein TRIVIDRAFT_73847 [Trichoderma virens Gv29-8]|uniref:Uncharacterized protein n=1 Tax=Hypocrea virens (strain Gv29-8 / FGSC 10586) TaxID=413071 RepID=G9MPF1_HYPVG|nr:uncharacterized protein TRIVIDRAFT_73847 [Trichoderma virens Gv29-8]EHK23752.1 hypothetical protein TRIVIDRAFT_73847 [Trichoderma virens Gv29-8]UKZ50051.1 hypothetical protein TrVGV298_004306 [Trichoderma virens]
MDFVKKAMGKAEGQQGAQGTGAAAPAAPQAQGGQAQKDDYVDKAFAMGAKKSGHNIDRNTQEKITDAGRSMYEKATGQKVDPKYSN